MATTPPRWTGLTNKARQHWRTLLHRQRNFWTGRENWRARARRWTKWTVGITALSLTILLGAAGYRLLHPPAWYLASHGGTQAQAFDDYRTSTGPIFVGLIQLAGGALLGIGLWFTWLQYRSSREQHMHDRIDRATDDLSHPAHMRRIAALHRLRSIGDVDQHLRRGVTALLGEFVRQRSAELRDNKDQASSDLREALVILASAPVDLTGISFGAIDLSNLDLSGLAFGGARFEGTNLEGTRFTGRLRAASMISCRLNGAIFDFCDMQDMQAKNCDFRSTTVQKNNLTGAWFKDCDFSFARFENNALTFGRFERVKFVAVQFFTTSLKFAAQFVDCDFQGAKDDQPPGLRQFENLNREEFSPAPPFVSPWRD